MAGLCGICSGCGLSRRLHSDGTAVYRHGPHGKSCPGSVKPPVTILDPTQLSGISGTIGDSQLPPTISNNEPPVPLFRQSLPHVTCVSPTSKHIPRAARPACVVKLTELLDGVLDDPDNETQWLNLLSFGGDLLSKPSRGVKRRNLAAQIKKRCTAVKDDSIIRLESSNVGPRKTCLDAHLAAAVTSKIESGNLRAAIRLLCSDESVAPFNADMAALLHAKHPSSSLGAECLPDPDDFPAFAVSQVEITSAIRSFPAGSGSGSDGLRPQHLVDLLTCKKSGLDLASRLTDFVNLLLEGKCPERIKRIKFGGKLIALRKKDRGTRPIAMGCYWRRLASKAANNRVMQSLAEYFSPLQLGVSGVHSCEAAVHAARRFIDNMQDD